MNGTADGSNQEKERANSDSSNKSDEKADAPAPRRTFEIN